MSILTHIAHFSALDLAALAFLFGLWGGLGWRIEHPGRKHLSTSLLMADYRKAWMREMITRQPRVFDAQVLGAMRQGTAFLTSTCMIALGGTLALIGNADRLAGVAEDIALGDQPAIFWELKLMLLVFFLTNAFLKFIWAHRLFGYCAVIMAAVPNDPDHPKAAVRAAQAGEINITGARSFNRGLRSLYFTLASTAWLAGAEALIAATIVTFVVIWRREFASRSRKILLDT